MARKTRGRFAPVLLVAVLGIAACGGSDSSSTTMAPTTDAPTTGATLTNFTPWADLPAEVGGLAASPVIDCAPIDGPLKAAWVYVGPINDGGWTQTHDEARMAVQDSFGDKIVTTYKENVPEGPQAAQVIEDLIADGNTVIFGTSFGFQDAFIAAGIAHPEVCFEFATGYLSGANVSQYYGAAEDTDYLAGMAAGAASKTGKLGYLASFPIPEVVRGINAWTMGARSVNPDATVSIVWVNSWFDPATERKSAEALIAQGVDVLGQKGIDSPSTGDAAKAAGIPWSGYNRDQNANYPEVWLTATTYHWDVYEIPRIQAVLDRAWVAGTYYGNIADGFVGLGSFGSLVTAESQAAIEARLAELSAVPNSEFTGPINDNKGTEVLAAGVAHTFGELMGMQYLVEGVIGEIPAS